MIQENDKKKRGNVDSSSSSSRQEKEDGDPGEAVLVPGVGTTTTMGTQ